MVRESKALLAVVIFFLSACGDGLGIGGDPGGLIRTGTAVEWCDMDPISGYDTEDIWIDGDIIAFSIGYGGGCEEHHFRLCWDGTVMDAGGLEVELELIHDAHGDACMAYVMETHRFSLVPLKEELHETYGLESGIILIDVDGYSIPYFL
jgi:hypothetical protein